MKTIQYETTGTCSQFIYVEVDDDDRVQNVRVVGGCHGNLQGIGALVRGMKREDVINKLKGIRCGHKPTSCPDQLSHALEEIARN